MTVHTRGIIRGQTIELLGPVELAEGTEVAIELATVSAAAKGEGLRRIAGILADDWTAADDEILEQLHQDRQNALHRDVAE